MTLQLSSGGRRYGFWPSLPDATTPRFSVSIPVATPPVVDLTPWLGLVKDQGQLGACTAFAGTGYLEYLYRRYKNLSPVLSPLFLYYKERELDGDLGQGDTGSFGSTTVKVIHDSGVCEESVDPYDISLFEQPPTEAQNENALKWKAGSYHAMDVRDIRFSLASGYPVLIGFSVYESFETGDWGGDAVMPAPSGSLLGGHEVFIKGYNDDIQAYDVRNSWGPAWGRNGDFWMPYALLPQVLSEARMQHFGKPW